jgi:murein DD-endopeptidase MepM/ murein hydrolase activator NlpD
MAGNTTRRQALQFAAGAAALAQVAACAAQANAQQNGLRLLTRPQRVFKTIDLPRERSEAWLVLLIAESPAPFDATPSRLTVTYFAGADEVARSEYWGAVLRAMVVQLPPAPEGSYWPFGLRVLSRQPAAANVDRMRVTITFDTAPPLQADIAVNTYTQRTDLIFPFRGNGIITQAGAATGGHRNGSGQFAIDAMGLSENYAVQTGPAFEVNTDLSGFGRDLIAPGAGIVVVARGDRPDQPTPGESNEDYHLPEFRGAGDPGNHVVIDHGAGEFSKVGHLMAGSLAVREGERVVQGQRIGQLGNSGDSFAPHVHHQLQDGPSWQTASALPHRYRNVAADRLDRGVFFSAT